MHIAVDQNMPIKFESKLMLLSKKFVSLSDHFKRDLVTDDVWFDYSGVW